MSEHAHKPTKTSYGYSCSCGWDSLGSRDRRMRAEAWEEGYAAGDADAASRDRLDRVNPYLLAQEEPHVHTPLSSFGDPYCADCGEDL